MIYIIIFCVIVSVYSFIKCYLLYKDNVEMSNIIQQQAELIKQMIQDKDIHIIELEKRKR